ncbi:MAG: hypothetical protein J0665_06410 [Deltaproteobacteria bacterium]|nr:hypothetical protein [Deltaproteobacteria bacterium]
MIRFIKNLLDLLFKTEKIKILSVKKVNGSDVYPGWKENMQVITTDKGEFTDNIPGSQYFSHAPGKDWDKEVGKELPKRKVVFIKKTYQNQEYDWIKWSEYYSK